MKLPKSIQLPRLRLDPRVARSSTFLLVIAALIGLASGAAILLFNASVEYAGRKFGELFTLTSGNSAVLMFVLVPLIPALGGLIVGAVNTWVFRMRTGHGVPEVILASRFARGTIPVKALLQKLVTASLSIGSGGGGGREGPIVLVGAAVGSFIAGLFRLTRDHSRTLIACGAAAGISGIFNAPIGGVLFVLEVILGDFRLKTFTPVVVASVSATAFTRLHYGGVALVHAPAPLAMHPAEYVFFAVLGIAFGALSAYFTRVVVFVEHACARHLPKNPVLRPALGGLLAGLFILPLPAMMEQSYSPINAALTASLPLWMMVLIALLKPLHAAVTVGSGGTGGMFAPAMKTGAMAGSSAGLLLMLAFPSLVASPTPYALTGMGALLAGTMHAPITAVLMVIEIANDYSIVLPAMLVSVLSVFVAQRLVKKSIYMWSIETDAGQIGSYAYLPTLNTLAIDPLIERDSPRINPGTPLPEILRIFETSPHEAILVTREDGTYIGLIEFEDVRSFLSDASMMDTIVAADVLVTSVSVVHPDTTLDVVMRLFDRHEWGVLPVTASGDDATAIGTLSSAAVHMYYRRSVARES